MTADYAASVVLNALEHGAQGLMFSVTEKTLHVLERLEKSHIEMNLYAIVPAAPHYARIASEVGSSGLIRYHFAEVFRSISPWHAANSLMSIAATDPSRILGSYVEWELSRVRRAGKDAAKMKAVLLHEIVTDVAIALNAKQTILGYLKRVKHNAKIAPGFVTRNFPLTIARMKEWQLDLSQMVISAPFNEIGFQMNPSKWKCEEALAEVGEANIIAMSIFAGGYLPLEEAIEYVARLPNLRSVVAGVSSVEQAQQTFTTLSRSFARR